MAMTGVEALNNRKKSCLRLESSTKSPFDQTGRCTSDKKSSASLVSLGIALILFTWITRAGATTGEDVNLRTMQNSRGFRVFGAAIGDNTGNSVSSAGDVNGDGVGDIIVGAFAGNSGAGVTYVIFGQRSRTSDVFLSEMVTGRYTGFRILGAGTTDRSGRSVSTAGDVNGDGIGDIIIGADFAASFAGTVSVIFGRNVTSSNVFTDINLGSFGTGIGFRIIGAVPGDQCGNSVSAVGDVNGDNIADVIVGAYGATLPAGSAAAGAAYVIFGRKVGGAVAPFVDISLNTLASSSGFRILGTTTGDSVGWYVSKAGDFNGDGVKDMAVSAMDQAGGNAGITCVIFGRNVAHGGATPFGDLNLASLGASGFRIFGAAANDQSGFSVSSPGDVNDDGIDDLLVGAFKATPANMGSPTRTDAGEVYVIFGRNSGTFSDIYLVSFVPNPTIGFRLIGSAAGDDTGLSVSSAGDMNGDGIKDMIIGAQGVDTMNGGDSGAAYVIFGRDVLSGSVSVSDVDLKSITLGSTTGFRIIGSQTSDLTGTSVSAAGDVNGDGLDDVIVGAALADPVVGVDSNAGIAYVVYGTLSEPTSQPSSQPSRQPSCQPTRQPSGQPSCQPIGRPTAQPSGQPSARPSAQPSRQPTAQPSSQPLSHPTSQPSQQPSARPSALPTGRPSCQPTRQPTGQPTSTPSARPTSQPSTQPSGQPSCQPVNVPTSAPTTQPSKQPTAQPSRRPSGQPSARPSRQPTSVPSCQPSALPSMQPSSQPSVLPTSQPSCVPTKQPTSSPSNLPSRQPSAQPSSSPSGQPTSAPSAVPSSQPSSRPSIVPSAEPSSVPTVQPSSQPHGKPTSTPSSRPSTAPSTQPTSRPTTQPSSVPIAGPTSAPSAQPASRPTRQPSCLPSAQPTGGPSTQPTSVPTFQSSGRPSAQPSTQQPTSLPSTQPSSQPSTQPSLQPTSAPSARPSAGPTGEWAVDAEISVHPMRLDYVNSEVWACGLNYAAGTASCAVLDAVTGNLLTMTKFDWNGIIASSRMPDTDLQNNNRVIIAGTDSNGDVVHSDVATCIESQLVLDCDVKSFSDAKFLAGIYLSYPSKALFIGRYNTYTSATIISAATNTALTYIYTLANMKSVVLSQVQGPPYFIGGFVAGTCARNIGSPAVFIVVGMIRTDTGRLSAMVLSPVDNVLISSSDLVNALTMENTRPDSFIAGGMLLDDAAGMQAYVVRANALFYTVQYCIRYHNLAGYGGRRALAGVPPSRTVMRGIIHVENTLFGIVECTVFISSASNTTATVVVQLDASTGAIIKQVRIAALSGSIQCGSILAAGDFIALLCDVLVAEQRRSVMINTDRDLTFSALPQGVVRVGNDTLQAEAVAMQRAVLSVASTKADVAMSTYSFTTAGSTPTRKPSTAPSIKPSSQPSSAPSSQPSSSPTTAPTLSARPTGQPSSASPTDSHKPTEAPTTSPSARPSTVPTPGPSLRPKAVPTKSPTSRPTSAPTPQPSVSPSLRPTHSPSVRATRSPTRAAPSRATITPSSTSTGAVVSDSSGRRELPSFVVGASIGSGLGALVVGYALYRYYQHRVELKDRDKRMKVYFAAQAALAERARLAREAEQAREAERTAERAAERAARREERNERMARMAERRSIGAYMDAPPPLAAHVSRGSNSASSGAAVSSLHSDSEYGSDSYHSGGLEPSSCASRSAESVMEEGSHMSSDVYSSDLSAFANNMMLDTDESGNDSCGDVED